MATNQPGMSPTLLVGAMYKFWDGEIELVKSAKYGNNGAGGVSHAAAEGAVRAFLRGRARELNGFEPVASRGGLVALRGPQTLLPVRRRGGAWRPRPRPPTDLRVCNPVTGELSVLPPPAPILDQSHVLLPCDGGGFKLYIVNIELLGYGVLQVQTYTSETGTWGSVVPTHAPLPRSTFLRPSPLVLRGVAYWLCMSDKLGGCYILAVHLDGSRRLTSIKLPDRDRLLKGRRRQRTEGKEKDDDLKREDILLTSTAAGGGRRRKLSLAVVTKSFTISTWTLEEEHPAARWTHTAAVDLWKMAARRADMPPLTGEKLIRLECFAESSGTVLFQLYHGTLYELDVKTGVVRFVGVYSKPPSSGMCAYDMVAS